MLSKLFPKRNPTYLDRLTPFEQIWTQVNELQNPMSTSWWFFLLLPEGDNGYGPEQMMFTYASRTGKAYGVNHQWQKGMKLDREIDKFKDSFMTTAAGWIFDGKDMHDGLVLEPVEAHMNFGEIHAWDTSNGKKLGASIVAGDSDKEELKVNFQGKNGYAKFKVWSTSEKEYEKLRISDKRWKLISYHTVATRMFRFEGEFKTPSGTFKRKGMCYFQRVCTNLPLMPWFWNYTVFQNHSIFSGFQPYIGLQLFRKRNWFLPGWLERATLPLFKEAYYTDPATGETTPFKNLRVIPLFDRGKYPWFQITATNKQNDYFKILYSSHGHTQFLLDHAILNQFRISRFNYNEYMLKVEKMKAKIGGTELKLEEIGPGYGNMEYTWGLGW